MTQTAYTCKAIFEDSTTIQDAILGHDAKHAMTKFIERINKFTSVSPQTGNSIYLSTSNGTEGIGEYIKNN